MPFKSNTTTDAPNPCHFPSESATMMMNSLLQKVAGKRSPSLKKTLTSRSPPPPPTPPSENDDPNLVLPSSSSPSPSRPKSHNSNLPPKPPSRLSRRKLLPESSPTLVLDPDDNNTSADSGVKVIVRIRPLREVEDQVQIADKVSDNAVSVADQLFTFDAVAGTHSTQEEIFQMVGLPLVENCLAGYNSSIFAYGQTGSGKTYTMYGPSNILDEGNILSNHQGITPRVFNQLFTRIQEEEENNMDKQLKYCCGCSFLEIYNEQITDLLKPSQRNLQIREDIKSGVYVENITVEHVTNMDDVTQLLLRGLANRRIGATSINAESSRSHSVFTCTIEARYKNQLLLDGSTSLRHSRINLVDLAGSERQKLTGAGGERLKEAGNINRSLSQLGNLINILAEVSQGRQRHIPYRDSRLTFLLQESLGGNAKLALICAISPASSCRSETLSTLRFAKRAKAIQNKAVVNEETEDDVNVLREQIRQLKDELVRMKSKDQTTGGSNNIGYTSSWNARRSVDILRQSLNLPLKLPSIGDEEMEIDSDAENSPTSDGAREQNKAPGNLQIAPVDPSAALECPAVSMSPSIDNKISTSSVTENLKQSSEGLRSSISRTESLAASLHRGLQIIDQHQQSLHLRTSSCMMRSFKALDLKSISEKVDVAIQTSPDRASSIQIDCCCKCHETAQQTSIDLGKAEDDASALQIVPVGETKVLDSTNFQFKKAVEGVLAGAIRREMHLGEVCRKQSTEIEQLNRLVLQYKHERECNSLIQHSKEKKILRLEGLMDDVLSTEEYMDQEMESLMNEHKVLKDVYENHPEVTRAMAEQNRLMEKLEKYRNFYDLGERDALLEEIGHLRNQLQFYLDSSASFRKRRLSLTSETGNPLALCTIPEHGTVSPVQDASVEEQVLPGTEEDYDDRKNGKVENEKQWIERESEWISLAEELRSDLQSYRRLAEKRQDEVECEKRCSEELKEALQMAMEGHARLLEQYAELQEKHISTLATQRKIKEGIADIRRAASKAGVKKTESRFIDAQAAQLVALKVERERERKAFREEIKRLQSQLSDTVEAVHAAGELLVRLKEAEENVSIAHESAAIAGRNTENLRRELERLNRRHAAEVASLNQELLELRQEKSSARPMCHVASTLPMYDIPLEPEQHQGSFPRYDDDVFPVKGDNSWFTGYDRCNI